MYRGISTEQQQRRITDQVAHIERMLEEATADPPSWLLVVGHYPIYSAGDHGDMSELSTNLLPLLLKYKVHAYICGHDHISEHLRKDGIEYFVAGAGSMTDQLKYNTQGEMIWYGVGYSAYASMEASSKELTITYRDWNNTVRYEYTLTNPFIVKPGRPGEGGGGRDGDGENAKSGSGGDNNEEGLSDSVGPIKRHQLIVTVSFGGAALIGIGILVYVYRERMNMVKRTKDIKVLDPIDEDFLFAISPNRRQRRRHHVVYKSSGTPGIELLELGVAYADKGQQNPMTTMATTTAIDTTNFTIQDIESMETTLSLVGRDDSAANTGTALSVLTAEDEEPGDKSIGHRSYGGYIRIKTDMGQPTHRRVQTSPI